MMDRAVGRWRDDPQVLSTRGYYGPWFGEFGHEIAASGLARAWSRQFEHMTVCSKPGSHALYADFADKFVPHSIVCEGVCATATSSTRPNERHLRRMIPGDCQVLRPVEYRGHGEVEWKRFGKHRKKYDGAILFHARNRPHISRRNWSVKLWHQLARELFRSGEGDFIVCVGTREHAFTIEGALDLRGASLEEQMDAAASARFGVGVSSGPMHLMQHCGCPIVVWCGGGEPEQSQTQARYLKGWNPFGTKARSFKWNSWQPPYERVRDEVFAMIEELGGS